MINDVLKPSYNFDADYVDLTDLKKVEAAIKPNTRMLWIETPTNPTLKISDIEELCKLCKSKGNNITVVVDSTFTTPYIQSPLLLGAGILFIFIISKILCFILLQNTLMDTQMSFVEQLLAKMQNYLEEYTITPRV